MWSYKYINIYIFFPFKVQNPNNGDVYLNYNNIIYYFNIIFK